MMFIIKPEQPSPLPPAPPKKKGNYAAASNLSTSTWLLASSASHHVMSNLENLSPHSPYIGSDDILIGEGTGLSITHTASPSLNSTSHPYLFIQCSLQRQHEKKLDFFFLV